MNTRPPIDAPLSEDDRIARIDNGFRVQVSNEHVVEVWRYLFNWRLVSMLPAQRATAERGYCFFGTGLESLARAIAAGLAWEDPLRSDPPDYDKRAF